MLDDSLFRVGGLGVDSLLEGLLVAAGLVFALDVPKKSFAVDGWDLGSSFTGLEDLGGSFVSAGFGFAAWAFAGTTAAIGGGRLAARLLTFLLIIEPYFAPASRGSSLAHSSCISRVTSARTWRFCVWSALILILG